MASVEYPKRRALYLASNEVASSGSAIRQPVLFGIVKGGGKVDHLEAAEGDSAETSR